MNCTSREDLNQLDINSVKSEYLPGLLVQSVSYLATDTHLTADPGVMSSIPARFHTFAENDPKIISTVVLLPSADSRRVVVIYKQKYVHEVLVKRLVKLFQKKSVVR